MKKNIFLSVLMLLNCNQIFSSDDSSSSDNNGFEGFDDIIHMLTNTQGGLNLLGMVHDMNTPESLLVSSLAFSRHNDIDQEGMNRRFDEIFDTHIQNLQISTGISSLATFTDTIKNRAIENINKSKNNQKDYLYTAKKEILLGKAKITSHINNSPISDILKDKILSYTINFSFDAPSHASDKLERSKLIKLFIKQIIKEEAAAPTEKQERKDLLDSIYPLFYNEEFDSYNISNIQDLIENLHAYTIRRINGETSIFYRAAQYLSGFFR